MASKVLKNIFIINSQIMTSFDLLLKNRDKIDEESKLRQVTSILNLYYDIFKDIDNNIEIIDASPEFFIGLASKFHDVMSMHKEFPEEKIDFMQEISKKIFNRLKNFFENCEYPNPSYYYSINFKVDSDRANLKTEFIEKLDDKIINDMSYMSLINLSSDLKNIKENRLYKLVIDEIKLRG